MIQGGMYVVYQKKMYFSGHLFILNENLFLLRLILNETFSLLPVLWS